MTAQKLGLISRTGRRLATAGVLTLALGLGGALTTTATASAMKNEGLCYYHIDQALYWSHIAQGAWNNNMMDLFEYASDNSVEHYAIASNYC